MMEFDQPADTCPQFGPPFPAIWPGSCVCGTEFDEGDLIQYDRDDDLVLVDCCGEDA